MPCRLKVKVDLAAVTAERAIAQLASEFEAQPTQTTQRKKCSGFAEE